MDVASKPPWMGLRRPYQWITQRSGQPRKAVKPNRKRDKDHEICR